MNRRTFLTTAGTALGAALAGCSATEPPSPETESTNETPEPELESDRLSDNLGGGIHRIEDQERGTVCYVVQNAGGGEPHIDCIEDTYDHNRSD